MPLLDIIISCLLCFFFLSGLIRGFLKSMIGPVAFFCCLLSAIIFYDVNCNILIASLITIFGTLALALTLNILLIGILAAVDKEIRGKVFPLSRLLGSVINLFWQGNVMFITFLVLTALPLHIGLLDDLRGQMKDSQWIKFYNENVINRDNRFKAVVASLKVLRNPEELRLIAGTREFERFRNEELFQKFINDPEAIDAFEAKDTLKLLGCKSLQTLVTNDNAMTSFSKLVEMVYEKNLRETGSSSSENPGG